MAAYYNEIDTYAAHWLRNLIAAGHIAPGDVDERSIEDVYPDDLRGYTQCHFFAGIGVWSHALRQAGWPDDQPIWTGSCPCQPFSSAGRGAGFADERHLWPAFFHLIRQCRPAIVFGEQVASKDGLTWLNLVQADLEGEGYAIGAVDTCAAGVGAPHIRQRLYWVAHATEQQHKRGGHVWQGGRVEFTDGGQPYGLGNPLCSGLEGHPRHGDAADGRAQQVGPTTTTGSPGGVDDTDVQRRQGQHPLLRPEKTRRNESGVPEVARSGEVDRPSPTNGHWRASDWLACRDGKWRPVEPGTCPLADGTAARVVRLRGYGNAIVAPQAQAFIEAVMECVR